MTAKALRQGWTTGACATAAARAAFAGLVSGKVPERIAIALPQGLAPEFAIHAAEVGPASAMACVIKDAGDDPDVTHGALVRATATPGPAGSGVTFKAGPGVGTVTRPGLPVPVGEPAINPGPRAMIAANLAAARAELGGPADVVVTVGIRDGEALAAKTMNGRLGIVGGLSILGTTGVVVPYSCAAWVATIQRGVDVALAAGRTHLAGATGRTSEHTVQALHGLPEVALIDMGDFAGALLKYLRRHPVPRLTIAGGFAKLAKLAQGHLDLHSSRSRLDLSRLATLAADPATAAAIATCGSGAEAYRIARAAGLDLAAPIARQARETALATLSGGTAVDVLVVNREGAILAHAGE